MLEVAPGALIVCAITIPVWWWVGICMPAGNRIETRISPCTGLMWWYLRKTSSE